MAAVCAARGMVEASVCGRKIVSFGVVADTRDRRAGGGGVQERTW